MKELTFLELMKISLVMPVLLLLSIVLVTVALERILFFAKNAAIDAGLFARIKKAVLAGHLADARDVAASGKGLIAEALAAQLLAAPHKNRSEMDHVLTLYFQRIQFLLSRRLWVFGTLSFISPLLGLLGTVLGVMTAFRDLAVAGQGGPTVVAAGISEALVATAAGITVAVTAALVYNYFNVRVKHVLNSLNILGQEITLLVTTGKDI
jgi:biopolymer transport protein ExbB